MIKNKIIFHDMGKTDYRSSLFVQEKIVEKKLEDKNYSDVLIYTEHKPVITLGKRGGEEFIDKNSEYFLRVNPEIVATKRGGLVTCHMPGQAVLYPILDLTRFKIGVRDYTYLLMDVMTDFLEKYQVESKQTKEYPGIWINNKKIGSIGLGIRKNITFHGLSLNINNDLGLFNITSPCGMKDASMTRLVDELDMDIEISMEKVKKDLMDSFLTIFNCGISSLNLEI